MVPCDKHTPKRKTKARGAINGANAATHLSVVAWLAGLIRIEPDLKRETYSRARRATGCENDSRKVGQDEASA